MKLTCDVCGGALQMNAGAQDATCKTCGMCYSIELLRSKLRLGNAAGRNTASDTGAHEIPAVDARDIVSQSGGAPVGQRFIGVQPQENSKQFKMTVDTVFGACLAGTVEQGTIGIGEKVYLNGDHSRAYTLRRFGNDNLKSVASAKEYVRLYIVPNDKQSLKQARFVTGDPVPAENAYRYIGREPDYFHELIKNRFPGYTVERNVSWPGLNAPISLLLCEHGRPALAIFVFKSHDAKMRYQAQKAERVLRPSVRCTHFYEDYRNDSDYVVSRIREALG